MKKARADAEAALIGLSWDKAYDFCERLYGFLACEVGIRDYGGDYDVITPKAQVQTFQMSSSVYFRKKAWPLNSQKVLYAGEGESTL
jgi:hypothetical protein